MHTWNRWPFDWRTPFGYLVALIGQCAAAGSMITVSFPFLNMIFGSCWIFIVIAGDITNDVAAFNDTVEILSSTSDRAESLERIRDIIQNCSDAKQ